MSYTPTALILPEYTDEALKSQRTYKGAAAEALLRVPAEYRQPVEAESWRRSTVTENRNGMAASNFIRDHHECRLEVIAEVLAQLRKTSEPTPAGEAWLNTYGSTE